MAVLIVEIMMTKITKAILVTLLSVVGHSVIHSKHQSFEDGLSLINWGTLRF